MTYGGRFDFKQSVAISQNRIGNSIRFGSQQSEVHRAQSTKKKNKRPKTPRESEKSTSKADFHGAKSNPHSRTSSTTRNAFGDQDFSTLNVIQEIKKTITQRLGYDKMTKCQELAIPPSLEGNDVLVKAKTGTGKTLGFLIPAINRLQTTTTVGIVAGSHQF